MERRVSLLLGSLSHPDFMSTQRYQARISNQLRRLGGSLDWSRAAFTMDEVSDFQTYASLTNTFLPLAAIQSRHGELLQSARSRSPLSRKTTRQLVCAAEHDSF